jgi:hypothetical protein
MHEGTWELALFKSKEFVQQNQRVTAIHTAKAKKKSGAEVSAPLF